MVGPTHRLTRRWRERGKDAGFDIHPDLNDHCKNERARTELTGMSVSAMKQGAMSPMGRFTRLTSLFLNHRARGMGFVPGNGRWRTAAIALFSIAALCLNYGTAAAQQAEYDLIIKGGVIYDGSGGDPTPNDIAIRGDRIAAIGQFPEASAKQVVDAQGLAVAPGFINVLSWATESLIEDGRAQSDIRQGVTLEVFGEGWSMGPLNDSMKRERLARQGDIKFDIEWTSLGDYLEHLEGRGVSANIASFVGATTVRIHELGYADRPPSAEELKRMQGLVRDAMREGALGVGASLIYAPAFYAQTDELTALAAAAAEYGGGYITHMRSEGDRFLEGIDETIAIAKNSGAWAQIYHLKPAGEANWSKRDAGIRKLEAARAAGIDIAANMYLYTAGATGLYAAMPPWVQEGGHDAWIARLKDPDIRARVIDQMRKAGDGWENLFHAAGGAENVLLIGFKSDALKPLTGKTLAAVAAERKVSPEDAIIDLVIEDNSRVTAAYFLMSEANIEANIAWPFMMFGSDAGAYTSEGVFLKSNPHPRAYGNVARLLGRYVREKQVISLAEAIRKLTSLPADKLRIKDRGRLAAGYFADIVIFDPETIIDRATYENPHQYAEGVRDVFVNGVAVLRDGIHTGATPGMVVRGPGFTDSTP
ncbi:MAG: D-aminoacylase [Pseudomonadota bacterium]